MLKQHVDPDKYFYSGYRTGYDTRSLFAIPDLYQGKNAIIFGVDRSWSLHVDNKNKDILIFGKGLTQGLGNTTLTAEAEYSINFSRPQRKRENNLHYKKENNLFIC